MSNISNEWKGIGRLVKENEVKTLSNEKNTSVLRNTVAIDNGKDKNGNELPADFIPITAFGKLADTINKYAKKGDLIAVSGEIKTDSYDGKDGNKVYTWGVRLDAVRFLQPKSNNNSNNNTNNSAPAQKQTADSVADTSFEDLNGIEDELPAGWGN